MLVELLKFSWHILQNGQEKKVADFRDSFTGYLHHHPNNTE